MIVSNHAKKAVFLDRDGVLIEDLGYVYKTEDLHLLPGVEEALKLLSTHGYLLVAITNQSGVARGKFQLRDIDKFHSHLQELLTKNSAPLDAIYVCPHHKDGEVAIFSVQCTCRKPGTKLVDDAIADWNIDRSKSYFVGDKDSDIECAINSSVTPLLVQSDRYPQKSNAKIFTGLLDAARFIIQQSN